MNDIQNKLLGLCKELGKLSAKEFEALLNEAESMREKELLKKIYHITKESEGYL